MTRGFYSKSTNSLCYFIMLFIAKETVRIDSGVFFRAFLLPYVLHRAEPRILLGYRLPAAGRAHTNDAAFFAARMAVRQAKLGPLGKEVETPTGN
jgi:hypothetical protein